MGIYDAQNTLSDRQAITGTARSTNVLKIGPGDFGQGEGILLDVKVTEKFLTLTSLKVSLQTDTDPAFGTAVTLYETPAIGLAELLIGYKFAIKSIPPGCLTYLSLLYTVVGSDATAGKIFASLTPDTQDDNPSF